MLRPVFELQQSAHEVDELWSLAKLGWVHKMLDKRAKMEAKAHADAQRSKLR